MQNRIYHGEIVHKETSYPGEHAAIIDEALWNKVQKRLADNRVDRQTGASASEPSLLAGLTAIGADTDDRPEPKPATAKAQPNKRKPRSRRSLPGRQTKTKASPIRIRQGTKQALLIDLLKRKDGATIDDIVEATGWQPHSVRGAISGALKKKLGLTVESEVFEDRGRVYRIVGHG